MSEISANKKMKQLLITGLLLVIAGYLMDPVSPIIKRISTSSFVIVTGGWTVLAMAVLYWIVDIRRLNGRWTLLFSVVSMNSLFIYMFAHLDGGKFLEHIMHPFTYVLFDWGGALIAPILTSLLVWAGLWGLCYWMYKKRLFIKI